MSKTFIEASADIEVAFYEVDPMQIVWHGNYVNYMERARCAILEKLQYSYSDMEKEGFGWPVVDIHIKYMKPLQFRQKIRVTAKLTEYEFGMHLSYTFIDIETGKITTKAESTQIAINLKTHETSIVSPKSFIEKVEAYKKKMEIK